VHDLIRKTCHSVSKAVTPLNKHPEAIYTNRGGLVGLSVKFADKKLRDEAAREAERITAEAKLQIKNGEIRLYESLQKFTGISTDFADYPLDSIVEYLFKLEQITAFSVVPNCYGMSAQVITELMRDPLLENNNVTLSIWTYNDNSLKQTHTLMVAQTRDGWQAVCDAWNRRQGEEGVFCSAGKKQNEKCDMYKSSEWQKYWRPNSSLTIQYPADLAALERKTPGYTDFFKKEQKKIYKNYKAKRKSVVSATEQITRRVSEAASVTIGGPRPL